MFRPIFAPSPTPNALGSGDLPTFQLLMVAPLSLHGNPPRISRYHRTISIYIIDMIALRSISFPPTNSNLGNIFLSREVLERHGTIEISAVIDWQHTAVLPLYLTALIPRFIEEASKPAPGQPEKEMLEKAYLRKAYHGLYQETGLDVVWASSLSFGYKFSMARQLPAAVQFYWHTGRVKFSYVQRRSGRILLGLRYLVLSALNHLQGRPPQAEDDERMWMEMEDAREVISKAVGMENDGWVRNEDYERVIEANEDLRRAWVGSLEKEEKQGLGDVDPAGIWPFHVEGGSG